MPKSKWNRLILYQIILLAIRRRLLRHQLRRRRRKSALKLSHRRHRKIIGRFANSPILKRGWSPCWSYPPAGDSPFVRFFTPQDIKLFLQNETCGQAVAKWGKKFRKIQTILEEFYLFLPSFDVSSFQHLDECKVRN